jgi:RNA-binding protein
VGKPDFGNLRAMQENGFSTGGAESKWTAMSQPNLRELKSRAQLIKPTIRLGKAGLTPEFLAAFDEALRHTPLLKLKFEDFKDERKTLSRELAERTGSQLVQQVGHTAVFFRAPAQPAAPGED